MRRRKSGGRKRWWKIRMKSGGGGRIFGNCLIIGGRRESVWKEGREEGGDCLAVGGKWKWPNYRLTLTRQFPSLLSCHCHHHPLSSWNKCGNRVGWIISKNGQNCAPGSGVGLFEMQFIQKHSGAGAPRCWCITAFSLNRLKWLSLQAAVCRGSRHKTSNIMYLGFSRLQSSSWSTAFT